MRFLPPPIRRAYLLIAACALLSVVDALLGLLVLRRFDAIVAELGDVAESTRLQFADGRSSLLALVITGFGVALALVGAAVAVRTPARLTRPVVMTVLGVVALLLTCGIAGGPEAVVSPTGLEAPEVRAALERLLPLWFSAVHGVVVTATFAASAAVAVLLGKEPAKEFYRRANREVRWRGFTSWLHVGQAAPDDR